MKSAKYKWTTKEDLRIIIMLLSIVAINTSIVGVLILIEWFTW